MTENMRGDRVNVVPSFDIITKNLLGVIDERLNVCVKYIFISKSIDIYKSKAYIRLSFFPRLSLRYSFRVYLI